MNVKILIEGDRACFTRPECQIEKLSYDVITPASARNILNSIYWKPEFRWVIDKIYIYNEPKKISYKYNGVGKKGIGRIPKDLSKNISINPNNCRQQFNITCLKDVKYIVVAHIELVKEFSEDKNNLTKHYSIFFRRMNSGSYFRQPFLGLREFPANVELVEEIPQPEIEDFYIGTMEYDINHETKETIMYTPVMKNGVINVPDLLGGIDND